MPTRKRLIAPVTLMFGATVAAVAFAMPASAADGYAPTAGTQVLGTSAGTTAGTTASTTASTQVAGVSESAGTSGLAFTGANAIGIGALGGLLLVGGTTMVVVAKRRKVNA